MRLHEVEPPNDWGKDLGSPVAVLRPEPEQLTRDAGLSFVPGYDDLDNVRVAAVSLESGPEFLLVKHEGKPQGGTEIVLSAEPGRDISRDFWSLLRALHLTGRDVLWMHPDISLPSKRRPRRMASQYSFAKQHIPARTQKKVREAVATATGVPQQHVEKVIGALAALAAAELARRGTFTLPGLARIQVIKKAATKARKGINPFTKEPTILKAKPARKLVRLRPLKALKDSLK